MNTTFFIRQAALLLALGLPTCALAQTGTGQIADGTWTLSQLSDREGTLRFAGPDAPTLRLLGTCISTSEGTQVSGNTGCNTFKTTAVFTSRTLRLRPIASTRRACEPARMQAEARYLKLLTDARRFVRHEQALIITTPQGRAVFMFGTYAQVQLQSTWRLVGGQGDTPLTVAFERGGQVLGTGGCNHRGGNGVVAHTFRVAGQYQAGNRFRRHLGCARGLLHWHLQRRNRHDHDDQRHADRPARGS